MSQYVTAVLAEKAMLYEGVTLEFCRNSTHLIASDAKLNEAPHCLSRRVQKAKGGQHVSGRTTPPDILLVS